MPGAGDEALWYKDAIIYEVRVRSFFDSVGDGMGDFEGLTRKLDYLQDLGVTALWVLPFYPSPLRDDGYDIADYRAVHPDCGTLQLFRRFVRTAHEKGLRIVTELVLNHTSDQHPWFQKARQPGRNPWRDYYVWSQTPDRYREARIIFKDFEPSNWTWDPSAGAYFWHRFFSHQPDLNYENPRVRLAMLRIVDFWLRLGVDGLRLDAVPYLFEREGTTCENLPETHAFLRELRAHVDARFPGRMLLAEANQWPEDAIAYFGAGDECQMCFHFPIMPRLFSALQMEDRFPVIDILAQTPPIPPNCQWALFLRNHDELTLEMVSDEERDYMYRSYAQDPNMRVNLGIRRRLAPLLGNDRRKLELMNGLLFSLPGTPVIYYGDEIGMGDNFFLGDRNGVRTPMQWNGDRNAGFSQANPHRLYLPVILDPEYHYETVNVETQQGNPHSLLWWMKRLIALRKRYRAFSRGSLEFLYPRNAKVLAFLRRHEDQLILIVSNLSRFVQYVELDLSAHLGKVPVELLGRSEFPPIEHRPYLLTLAPHAFYWFLLERERRSDLAPESAGCEALEVEQDWEDVLRTEHRAGLEERLLKHLPTRSWFRGRARDPRALRIVDAVPMPVGDRRCWLVTAAVEYAKSPTETYLIPLGFAVGENAQRVRRKCPQYVISGLDLGPAGQRGHGVLFDAAGDPAFCLALLAALAHRRRFASPGSIVRAVQASGFRRVWRPYRDGGEQVIRVTEQSNTAIFFGSSLVLKLFRCVEEGRHPGLELGLFLAGQGHQVSAPEPAAHLEHRRGRHGLMTFAILHPFVLNEGTAWQQALDAVGHFFDSLLERPRHAQEVEQLLPSAHLLELAAGEPSLEARELIGPFLDSAARLGQVTAGLHRALESASELPALAPERFTKLYQRSFYQSLRNLLGQAFQSLEDRFDMLPSGSQGEARRLLDAEPEVHRFIEPLKHRTLSASRTRYHGNWRLTEVLNRGKDYTIVGLEGDPSRRQSEMRIKRSPLCDVASMIRSFHDAAYGTLVGQGAATVARPEDLPALEPWTCFWHRWVAAAYLRAYLKSAAGASFVPSAAEELDLLLRSLLLERTLQDLKAEVVSRPERAQLPLRGLSQLLWPEAGSGLPAGPR